MILLGATLALSGCQDGLKMPAFLQKKEAGAAQPAATRGSTRLVERDVEAPEVFQVTDQGLWDGRPSLGGVWVAHESAQNPERVIIRNEENGNFVIGALFKREISNPGPALQVSSDAAEALGMLAGAPARLNVTALKREEVPLSEEVPGEAAVEGAALDAAEPIQTQSLDEDDPIIAAAAAIERSEAAEPVISPPAPTAPAPTPAAAPAAPTAAAPARAASSLDKPYIQIGIFSVQGNAQNTAEMMRKAGIVPTIDEGSMSGKTFYRVIVGPATSAAERGTLLTKVKGLGFTDAYAVKN